MPHVPETSIHLHAGRRVAIQTEPVEGLAAADVAEVRFVVQDRLDVSSNVFEDTEDGLVVTVTLTEEDTAAIGVGRHRWQLLPTSASGELLEPLAAGRLRASALVAAS